LPPPLGREYTPPYEAAQHFNGMQDLFRIVYLDFRENLIGGLARIPSMRTSEKPD
jgi:hypothetical protein